MLEELIIRHCSPTLAGLKTGNLFNCTFVCYEDLQMHIDQSNNILNPKGVYITLLQKRENNALIYVYRYQRLLVDISKDEVKKFLKFYGYSSCDIKECIQHLSDRLLEFEDFPHEIGLFLGYPLNDVKAFIENKGRNYKYVGFWKVYFDEYEAIKTFAKYKKCTSVYCKLYTEGRSIQRLTVVA